MNDRIREQLLGYLLGALDEDEREEIERHLESDVEWQNELESLATMLEPLAESHEEFEPPACLAEQTCSLVAEQALITPAGGVRPLVMRNYELGGRNRWSLADAVVFAGICVAATLLFFPAIAQSRYTARLQACQNNLRQLGIALVDFSEKAGRGYFPEVPAVGNRAIAGIYGPVLVEAGYLTDRRRVVCPSSRLAERVDQWELPTLVAIDQASGRELAQLQQLAGGSYGYSLGVVVDGRLRAPRNQGRTHFALMSDAPSIQLTDHRSANHGGCGQNLLFEDGHIRYVADLNSEVLGDHPFENRLGWMEAGIDVNDAVIAPSFSPPFATNVSYAK